MVYIHHPFYGCCTDIEFSFGIIRDNIRCIAAFCDDAVDTHILRQLLAQQADGIEHQDHCIECVDAVMRCRRSVGCFSFEFNSDRCTGNFGMCQLMVVRPRMHTQSRIHITEKAFPHKASLRTAVFTALFAGRSVNTDFSSRFVDHLLQGSPCKAGRRTEKIMSAGMADPVQSIVFREEAEHGARFGRLKCRCKTRSVPGYVRNYIKSLFFQLLREGLTGKKRIIADFRPGMDVQGDLPVDRILPVNKADDVFPARHGSFLPSPRRT